MEANSNNTAQEVTKCTYSYVLRKEALGRNSWSTSSSSFKLQMSTCQVLKLSGSESASEGCPDPRFVLAILSCQPASRLIENGQEPTWMPNFCFQMFWFSPPDSSKSSFYSWEGNIESLEAASAAPVRLSCFSPCFVFWLQVVSPPV